MNSGSNDNRSFHLKSILRSFGYAVCGIKQAIKSERNMKIHLLITILVMIMGLWLNLSVSEWIWILFAVFGTLALELVNTAIERVVDMVTEEYHPLAQQAKDMAAGAVFLYAILSVILGLIIFVPKIW